MVDERNPPSSSPPSIDISGADSGLLTSVDAIKDYDERLWDVTRSLPIKLGSVLRLPSSAYAAWNIGLTDENKVELAEISRRCYERDYEEDRRFAGNNPAKQDLMSTPLMESIEGRMRRSISSIVAEMATEFLLGSSRRRLVIADISANNASLCIEIASAICEATSNPDNFNRLDFHIAHKSPTQLENTVDLLKDHKFRAKAYLLDGEDFLAEQRESSVDYIVSMPYLHRKSFPDFAGYMHRALVPGGVAVCGDIHSPLWNHPYYVYKLLEGIGIDPKRLDAFKDALGDRLVMESVPGIQLDELMAKDIHMKMWKRIAMNIRSERRLGNQRVFILGAHDTISERMAKFGDAGLKTDADEIRRAFQLARLPGLPKRIDSSGFAVVTAAMRQR